MMVMECQNMKEPDWPVIQEEVRQWLYMDE